MESRESTDVLIVAASPLQDLIDDGFTPAVLAHHPRDWLATYWQPPVTRENDYSPTSWKVVYQLGKMYTVLNGKTFCDCFGQ